MVSPSAWVTSSEHQYDVFLSYRGPDTGDNFKSHLDTALLGRNIRTFADTNMCRGEDISPSLVKAIQGSKLSVIIFSQNYASSTWCLDEAAMIMECKRLRGQIVIPVFYRVTPSQVRCQTGSYAEAFAKHKRFKYEKDRILSWRTALTQAANLAGWDSQTTRPESELIKGIVADLRTKLNRVTPNGAGSMMRIDYRAQQPESLLRINTGCGPRGMEIVTVDPDNNLVVVRGSTMDAKDLALYVKDRFKRNVEAVPEKKTEEKTDKDGGSWRKEAAARARGEKKKEADGSESKGKGEEIKNQEEVGAEAAERRTRNEERNDGKEWEARTAAKAAARTMQHDYRYSFRRRDDDSLSLVQMFSDENPNSYCSIL